MKARARRRAGLNRAENLSCVAEANSFTRAAAELGYSQSSVTMHVRALEEELGVSLFDRVGRGVILTEVGRCTFDYAGRLLALAEETKAAVHK
jgi:DNA-binding transcriptional LysR family regulator